MSENFLERPLQAQWTIEDAKPIQANEIDLMEKMAIAVLNDRPAEGVTGIQVDPGGYLWGKPRNALNRYVDPVMVLRIVKSLREKQ